MDEEQSVTITSHKDTSYVIKIDNEDALKKLPVMGDLIHCSKCHRSILVERTMIGTNHTAGISVVCWDCLSENNKVSLIDKYKLDANVGI